MAVSIRRPRKTVEDYFALPDDVRAELIDGELYVTPARFADHQRVVVNLTRILSTFVLERDLGEVFVAPIDVILPTGDAVQPDVLFVSRERSRIVERWIEGVPDLLVEIVSPGHAERDRSVKRRLYERNSVPEYWIVDLEERSIEVLRHDGVAFRPAGFLVGSGLLRSPALPGLALPLDDVLPRR
jgi:Uma2 family endonuclease